ncbi:non-ribosomal peptide synthetase [Streptomyces sp. NPDC001941]|uniref:non-ribosomal peptide synthetase n=1 Tax=Streptomyces sp. NPDC001941 TaxID=3154659 RepID=UPI003321915D
MPVREREELATCSVVEQFRRLAHQDPHAPAASDADGAVTRAELWSRAEAVARLLRARGHGDGRPVAVAMAPGVPRLAALLGVMAAGAPYVPVDPGLPDARLRVVLDGTSCLLVDDGTADRFAALPHPKLRAPEHAGDAAAPAAPAPTPGGRDLAYVLYTSGSTGTPKGVAVEHAAVSSLFADLDEVLPQLADRSRQCWLAAANVCFDMSVVDLFWPLTRGIPLVVADIDSLSGTSESGAEFLTGVLAGGGVTHFQSTPSLVQLMLRDPELATAVRGLHMLLMGGEIVTPALVAQLVPVPYVFNGYGPTETTVYTTLHACSAADTEQVPIGRALRGVRLRVVDEDGRERPAGERGELLIGGAGLARGYQGDPVLTDGRFPLLDEGDGRRSRWYRTGDLVSRDAEGTVSYHGRLDSQVKVRGFRIELGEVEAALRAVDGIEEAAVFPRRDDTGRVTGLVAAAADPHGSVRERDALEQAARTLPGYAVPDRLHLLPRLPLGLTGKLDRKALEARLLAPAATAATPPARTGAPGPEPLPPALPEALPEAVAAVWSEVLDERVAADTRQNFFDLGGNSLLLGRVFTRLTERFPEAGLGLVELYRYPTVPALAGRLAGAVPAPRAPRAPQPVPGGARPSAAERRRLARRTR